jgi:hypothetical protein
VGTYVGRWMDRVNEKCYRRKLKSYKETNPDFIYVFPIQTLTDREKNHQLEE